MPKLSLIKYSLSILVPLVATGCVSVSKTPLPTIKTPTHWQQATVSPQSKNITPCSPTENTDCYAKWWTVLNDKRLNTFLDEVMQHNIDLKNAAINVQKSNLMLQKTQDARGVVVSNTATINRQGHYNLSNQSSDNVTNAGLATTATWEFDIWGKLADQQAFNEWEKQATIADKQAVYMSLSANALRSYFQLANLNERIAFAKQSLANAHNIQRVLSVQLKAGKIAPIDMVNIAQTINQYEINYQNLLSQKNELLNTMAVMMGTTITALPPDLAEIRQSHHNLPSVPIGIPAQTVANRPDIQLAVWRLKQALIQYDINEKNLYPNIVLTAGASTASTQLLQILKTPLLNWGIAINLPALDRKEAKRTLQNNDLAIQQAVLNYQDSLNKAFADIETKLSQLNYQQTQISRIRQNQIFSQQLLTANHIRYKAGTLPIKQLLDSEEETRQSTISVYEAELNEKNAWINLNQALGGIHY